MKPKPPSNADGAAPPLRPRSDLASLSKDTTEVDLWAFDDLEVTNEPVYKTKLPGESAVLGMKRAPRSGKAAGKEPATPKNNDGASPRPSGGDDRIQVNVSKAKTRHQPTPSLAKPGGDFEDLEQWEEHDAKVEATEATEAVSDQFVSLNEINESPQVAAASKLEESEEFSPVPAAGREAVSIRPNLSLSKLERAGVGVLLAILLLGAVALVVFSINRLPTESARAAANDFPIKGQNLTVEVATSYWRPPIFEGAKPDTFRRGTILLPVLTMEVADGSAGLRVIFRNQDGESIGDVVTRSVRAGQKLEIPATAGFDDLGMHAAYRTGESKPWTVEVLEAPAANSPNDTFVRLFEMNISTDRR